MNKNQKGAIDVLFVITLVVVLAVGGFLLWRISNVDEGEPVEEPVVGIQPEDELIENGEQSVKKEVITVPDGWELYEDEEHNYAYIHPENLAAQVSGLGGNYGSNVFDESFSTLTPLIKVEVLITPSVSTQGENDMSYLRKTINDDDPARLVAQKSNEINRLDDNPHINPIIGDVTQYNIFSDTSAWGFSITEGASSGFIDSSSGGFIVDEKVHLVYVENNGSIFRIIYIDANEDSKKIFESLDFRT